MLNNLKVAVDSEQKSDVTAKKLIKKITTDFEENMNNDLQVKATFDSLYKSVSKLVALKEKQKLSVEDSKEALQKLKAIDYVLQVIF